MHVRLRLLLLALVLGSSAGSARAAPAFTDITPPAARGEEGVTRIAVHPLYPDQLIAATRGGIRVSRDAGTTWSEPTFRGAKADRLFVHKGRPGVVFLQEEVNHFVLALGPVLPRLGGPTYRSADFGATWTLSHRPAGDVPEDAVSPFGSDPAMPERLFATAAAASAFERTNRVTALVMKRAVIGVPS